MRTYDSFFLKSAVLMKPERNIDAQRISDKAVSEVGQGIPLSAIGGKNSTFLSAFTLLEVLIALALFGLVMAGTIEVYIMCNKVWHATSLSMDTSRMASLAIQRMVYGLGTNCGLRSAASISVNTNVHKDGCSTFVNYWDTTAITVPAANNDSVNTFCPYTSPPLSDGSWRIVMSNAFDGVKWIDYVKQQRSIVFWQNTTQPASRVSVCNYVINSTAANTLEGITIELTVWKKDGMFVKKRNN